jgi:hypothetical protein
MLCKHHRVHRGLVLALLRLPAAGAPALAAALGAPVERFAEGMEDPGGTNRRRRRSLASAVYGRHDN